MNFPKFHLFCALFIGASLPSAHAMEKTYNIRDEIGKFFQSKKVENRFNENNDDMWEHNIDDIKAHFSKIVKDPAAFSLALNQVMKQSGPEEEPTLRSMLKNSKFIPLLCEKDTPALHCYLQKLCKKAGDIDKPLILLMEEPPFNNSPFTVALEKNLPFVTFISYKDISAMSDQSIKGGLAHEMGHIKYHHLDGTEELNTLTEEEERAMAFNREYEADKSACIDFDEGENLLGFLQEILDEDEECQAFMNPSYPNHKEIINIKKQTILKEIEQQGNCVAYQNIANFTDEDFVNLMVTAMGFDDGHPPVKDRIAKLQEAIAAKRNQK